MKKLIENRLAFVKVMNECRVACFWVDSQCMPRRSAQQRMTLSDLERSFHGSSVHHPRYIARYLCASWASCYLVARSHRRYGQDETVLSCLDPVSNLKLLSLKDIEDYWKLGNWKLGLVLSVSAIWPCEQAITKTIEDARLGERCMPLSLMMIHLAQKNISCRCLRHHHDMNGAASDFWLTAGT